MPVWSIQLLIAIASSFAAVVIGSGGDVLFLSSLTFVLPLVSHTGQNTFALGPLVATQGAVATLIGGVAYSRIAKLPARLTMEAMGSVMVGSLGSSIVANMLPSLTLRIILASATTIGALKIFLNKKLEVSRKGSTSGGLRKEVLLFLFGIGALTGGLGVGGGFLFFIALMNADLSIYNKRGLTLILTFTNLASSFAGHILTASVALGALGYVALGALIGSLLAARLIRRLDERVARWGLRVLLTGSAVIAWLAVGLNPGL